MIRHHGWKSVCSIAGLVSSFYAANAFGAEFVLKFKNKEVMREMAVQESLEGALISDSHENGSLLKLDFGNLSSEEIAQRLSQIMEQNEIEYAVENFKLYRMDAPNDPQFEQQWALTKVRASEAWNVSTGSRDVVVAVIDTGIDVKHEDLQANIWKNSREIPGNGIDDDGNGFIDDVYGWDFHKNNADPKDETSSANPGHGTHCAGIIGAVGNNGKGISGIAQNTSLMALRFLGSDGSGDLMSAIKAIDYAIAQKVDIISASWGAKVPETQAKPLIEAIGRANSAGITFVAAASNDSANNDSTSMYPANTDLPNVITVAASTSTDERASFSNYGKAKVHVAAPGHQILSTLPGDKFGNLSGTSMATPLVAGLVALIKSQGLQDGRDLNPSAIRSLIQSTGAKSDIETACMCRIDAAAAVAAVRDNTPVVVPAAATYAPGATASVSAIGGKAPYSFASQNPAVIEVDAEGKVTAKTEGETTIKVTDAAGTSFESRPFRVAVAAPQDDSQCPLKNDILCKALCLLDPKLPWCSK